MYESRSYSILLVNDDGYLAPGIRQLWASLGEQHDVTMVAPESERSGFSAAITLHEPIRYTQKERNIYACSGTPVDCAHLGLRQIMAPKPDFVISGINRGPNLGDDTLFSGTVGAANVACLEGVPAMAVSMGDFNEPMYYETAALVVSGLLQRPDIKKVLAGRVLNINVPNLASEEVQGVRETCLARRHYPGHFECDDRDGDACWWYGKGPVGHDNHADSDVTAIEQKQVSLTFLRPHLLDHLAFEGDDLWELPERSHFFP